MIGMFKKVLVIGLMMVVGGVIGQSDFVVREAGAAGLADSPWPMFGHDVRHTGQSTYKGVTSSFLKWELLLTGSYSSPSIGSDGTIYVGAGSSLKAINSDGTVKWSYYVNQDDFNQCITSSPAIDLNGTIYISSNSAGGQGEIETNNYLYAINPDGTLKWKYLKWNTMYGRRNHSSPTIGPDGTIYDGSRDNYLYAVNPDGSLKWRYQTGGAHPLLL